MCGPDGCGEQCGVCAVGEICTDEGLCTGWSCSADCTDKVCGADGCGGSCGTCEHGEICLNETGQCIEADPCGGLTYEGCCDGAILYWCDAGVLYEADCGTPKDCGWSIESDGYDCDTSGGSDPEGVFPQSCDALCSCDGKECGDDGCGKSCGTCADGSTCDVGTGLCGEASVDGCQGIPYEGCCAGEVLTWCEYGALETIDCADNPLCGWSPADGFYNCETDGAAEASGTFPMACPMKEPVDKG